MKTGFTSIFKVCLPVLTALACVVGAHAATLTTAEYSRQLDDLSARVEQIRHDPSQAAALQAEVPDKITVTAGSREYSLSYDWFKQTLKQYTQAEPQRRAEFLDGIQARLHLLKQQVQAFESAAPGSPSEQDKLKEILSRREFRKVRGPNALEIWWEKFTRWLDGFFTRHQVARSSEDFFHILIYAAVAVALACFVIWLKRRLDRPAEPNLPREIIPFAPSARGWRSWLAEARAFAQQGDWRNGIHLAYWAGISFLEEGGAWRPDRARTPREYLRLLTMKNSRYPVLASLTGKFEVVWYGGREAGAHDFQETLSQLEKLGCR